MYLINVEVKESPINGKGVFALQKISKGEVVWKFDPSHDKILTVERFEELTKDEQESLKRVAYLSGSSGKYVFPPENDPALYTNHSRDNNLSVLVDENISPEPYFVANKDIEIGEELTNNYTEFDDALKQDKPSWV